MTEHPRPDIREIRTVVIPVTDQDRALRFYTGTSLLKAPPSSSKTTRSRR
jgi:hypothetical protein